MLNKLETLALLRCIKVTKCEIGDKVRVWLDNEEITVNLKKLEVKLLNGIKEDV